MKVIGLAGQAGCGKSAVGRKLAEIDYIVWIDLDRLSWEVYAKGTYTYNCIVSRFGRGILSESGQIDRARLGKLVFSDKRLLGDLNALVHPALSKELRSVIESERKRGAKVLLVEGALLGVSKHVDYSLFDGVVWLVASLRTRAKRLRDAGRADHLGRSISRPRQINITEVDAEGTIEQTSDLVLKAISKIA